MPILPIDTGRYGTPEMLKIFEEENYVQKLLDVEAALAWAHAQVGNIPKEDAEKIEITSYDVVDTAKALQLKEAVEIIGRKLDELELVLLRQADCYKETIMIGRTHGQHALPITFGLKLSVWMREISRHIQRLRECKERLSRQDERSSWNAGGLGNSRLEDPRARDGKTRSEGC